LNPQNGVPIQIPERVTVVFSPGLDLRELLNTEARASRRA
jgi:nucleoid DNA-binding protein